MIQKYEQWLEGMSLADSATITAIIAGICGIAVGAGGVLLLQHVF